MKIFNLVLLIAAAILITSCSSDSHFQSQLKQTLKKNPEILFEAIAQNPSQFMMTVQQASRDAKEDLQKEAVARERDELNEALANPLKPAITDKDFFLGPKDAPITIVEYSDFQCPFCAQGKKTIYKLMKKYPGKIRFVFKHLPLNFHPQAMISAKYFEAIAMQSPKKAFNFHDMIFDNQAKLKNGEAYLTTLSKKLALNLSKLKKDINSEEIAKKINDHQAEAKKFNIQGTPGFIINGIPVRGAYPAEYFDQIISKLIENGKLTI